MRPLYPTLQDLKNACVTASKRPRLTPRIFRIYIGVSKSLLSHWKNDKPDYFNLIKDYEDRILAKIEQMVLYSGKKNITIGGIFVLKAYDPIYKDIQYYDNQPIIVSLDNDTDTKIPTRPKSLPNIKELNGKDKDNTGI